MLSPRIRIYYKLTKPGIVRGNMFAAVAGYFYGAGKNLDATVFMSLGVGLALIIAAACVLNNIFDRDMDSHMKRTKERALVTGEISVRSAAIYAAILLGFGTIILGLGANVLALLCGLLGVFMYVVVYGVAKRTTVYSTLIGSISGAIPPVVGYSAATGQLTLTSLLLFISMTCWQMPHFYAISLFRKKEYSAAGVPVMSVKYSARAVINQINIFILLFIAATILLYLYGPTGKVYVVSVVGLGLYWLRVGIKGYSADDISAWALQIFKISLFILSISSVILSIDAWLP